jgi:hypothetical protein
MIQNMTAKHKQIILLSVILILLLANMAAATGFISLN